MGKVSLMMATLLTLACSSNGEFNGDGVSEYAPNVQMYIGMGEDCCGEDPHPVHGVEASDGAFVLGGKFIDSGGTPNGFVVKLSSVSSEHPKLLEEGV